MNVCGDMADYLFGGYVFRKLQVPAASQASRLRRRRRGLCESIAFNFVIRTHTHTQTRRMC